MARSASAIADENAPTGATAARTSSAESGAQRSRRAAGLGDHVLDQAGDDPAHQLMTGARGLDRRAALPDHGQKDVAHERDLREIVEREQVGAQPVVDVVGVVGDVVGDRGDLRLGAGEAPQFEVLQAAIVEDRLRHAALAVAPDRLAVAVGQRTVVLDQPFERLPGEIETVEGGVAPLERRDDAQRLGVVVEAAGLRRGSDRARARRRGRTADARGRAPAPAPRSGPRRARARAPASGRSARLRAYG